MTVDELDSPLEKILVHLPDVIGRDLVTQPTRARMQHDDDLALFEPERLRACGVEEPVYLLDLEKVVSAPQGAQLTAPALARLRAHEMRIGAGQASVLFLDRKVRRRSAPLLDEPSSPPDEHFVHLRLS